MFILSLYDHADFVKGMVKVVVLRLRLIKVAKPNYEGSQ